MLNIHPPLKPKAKSAPPKKHRLNNYSEINGDNDNDNMVILQNSSRECPS